MSGRPGSVAPDLGVLAVLALSVLGGCGDGDTPSSAAGADAGGGSGGTSGWTVQTVDESPTAIAAALALDGSGYAHIAYSDNPVLYATNASGSWSSEPLEPEAGAHSPSLAVSKNGVVHVAFVRDGEIWYLRNQDGIWAAEPVAAGEGPSITADGSGSAHISFTSEESGYYATKWNGEWVIVEVLLRHFSGDYVSGYSQTFPGPTSIAIGANDRPRIVYNEHRYHVDSTWSGSHLYYAESAADGWASCDVAFLGRGAVRVTNDIIADPDGLLHASYGAEDNDLYGTTHAYRLVYSGPVSLPCGIAEWREPFTVDQSETVRTGISSAVGLDPWGGVHICYYTQDLSSDGKPSGCALRYASNAEGSWTTESIDADCAVPDQGRDALAVDAAGVVHVVYHANNGALMLAKHESAGNPSDDTNEAHSEASGNARDCSEALTFSSQPLCEAVWNGSGKPSPAILSTDVATLTELAVSGVSSLGGIECLAALSSLRIVDFSGLDLAPLASLTNLTSLEVMFGDVISIEPLASMTSLTSLDLGSMQIVDVGPLASLTHLTSLDLQNNAIVDIAPLASLTNLTSLALDWNGIEDVAPLASLKNLRTLFLDGNEIADISPLLELDSLESLYLLYTPLDCASQSPYLDELRARGVAVSGVHC